MKEAHVSTPRNKLPAEERIEVTLSVPASQLARLAELLRGAPGAPASPQASGNASRLLTKRELAELLGVAPGSLDRWSRVGLPFELVGERRRYDAARVRAWLASRDPKPAKAAAPADAAVARVARAAGLRVVGGGR